MQKQHRRGGRPGRRRPRPMGGRALKSRSHSLPPSLSAHPSPTHPLPRASRRRCAGQALGPAGPAGLSGPALCWTAAPSSPPHPTPPHPPLHPPVAWSIRRYAASRQPPPLRRAGARAGGAGAAACLIISTLHCQSPPLSGAWATGPARSRAGTFLPARGKKVRSPLLSPPLPSLLLAATLPRASRRCYAGPVAHSA